MNIMTTIKYEKIVDMDALNAMFLEYKNNGQFRKIVNQGEYVYAEGMMVLNYHKYVQLRNNELLLTDYAWENLDSCTINFEIEDVYVSVPSFGSKFSTAQKRRYKKKNLQQKPIVIPPELEGMQKVYNDSEEFCKEFYKEATGNLCAWDMVGRVLNLRKVNNDVDFAEITGLSESVYDKIMKKTQRESRSNPMESSMMSLYNLIAIIAGLNVPTRVADEIIARAGHTLTPSKEINSKLAYFIGEMNTPLDMRRKWLMANRIYICKYTTPYGSTD